MILFITYKAPETLGVVDFFINSKESYFAVFLTNGNTCLLFQENERLLIKSNIILERKRLEEMRSIYV